MFLKLIRNTEWGHLLDFVSPAFFRVIKPGDLKSQIAVLSKSAFSRKGYEEQVHALAEAGLPGLALQPKQDPPETDWEGLSAAARKEVGHHLLRLYFHQILHSPEAFIDLRLKHFGWESAGRAKTLVWKPGAIRVRWEEGFRKGLSEIYRGFFAADDRLFEAGLKRLGLTAVRDIFLRHFGDGGQKEIPFTIGHFLGSFHDVFVRMAEKKQNLRGQFVVLGFYLATLYESLDRLGGTFNVRAQFSKCAGDE